MDLLATYGNNAEKEGLLPTASAPETPLCCSTGCARWLPRIIPTGCLQEAKELAKLGVPLIVSILLTCTIGIVSSIFCGHLGKMELDAVSLANAIVSVTGISVGTGFSSACDTLISQSYGSCNLKHVGVILQRGILLLLLICFPCWALFINTENILLLVRQDPEVARLAQTYVLIFIPALPANFLFALQTKYLQNQGIILPQIFTALAANIVNVVINYVFLFVLHLGVMGSALANTISQFSLSTFLFLYIRIRKLHVLTWGGWSWECLQEWGPFTSLAVPSMLILCFEWWIYEIGNLVAGLISVTELGAQSVMYQICTVAYMLPYGLSVAASVRVGNALGAGNQKQAKRSALVALYCTVVLVKLGSWMHPAIPLILGTPPFHLALRRSTLDDHTVHCLPGGCRFADCYVVFIVLDTIALAGSRNTVARLFTNDKAICDLTARTLPVYIVFHIFESMACAANGVLRGSGKQLMGAVVFAVGYYLIGLPVGAALMFSAKLGIVGFWIGMVVCGLFLAATLLAYVSRLNWNQISLEAQERTGVKHMTIEPHLDTDWSLNIGVEPDLQNGIAMTDIHQAKTQPDQPGPLGDRPKGTAVTAESWPTPEVFFRRGLALVAAVVSLLIGILIKLWLA